LKRHADNGNRSAAYALVDVLREQGRIDEIRAMAETGIANSRYQLAEMLRERDEVDELRARAADLKDPAVRELVRWLADHEEVDEIEALALANDSWALAALARLAPERLWTRARAGDTAVTWYLLRMYEDQRNVDKLRELAPLGGM